MLEGITILETEPITETSPWIILLSIAGALLFIFGMAKFDNSVAGPISFTIGVLLLVITIIGVFTFLNVETGRNKYTVKFERQYNATELYDAGYKIDEHLPYSEVYIIKEIETK